MSKDEKLLRLEQRMVLDVIRMTSLFLSSVLFFVVPLLRVDTNDSSRGG